MVPSVRKVMGDGCKGRRQDDYMKEEEKTYPHHHLLPLRRTGDSLGREKRCGRMDGMNGAERAKQRVLLAQGLEMRRDKERDREMDSDGLTRLEGHHAAVELAPVVASATRKLRDVQRLLQLRKFGEPAIVGVYR